MTALIFPLLCYHHTFVVLSVKWLHDKNTTRGDNVPAPWHIVGMGTEITLDLDEKQAAFVAKLLETGDEKAAAVAAGYTEMGATKASGNLMRQPQVLAAIHLAVARRLVSGAPIALGVVYEILRDTKAGTKVRLDAAKLLLDRAGHIAPRARQVDDGAGKSLNEMSIEELRETQDRLQSEILSRAKTVGAPSGVVAASEDDDLLG